MICEPVNSNNAGVVKSCGTCGISKPASSFAKRPKNKLASECKSCKKEYDSRRYGQEKIFIESKSCSACGQDKRRDEFYASNRQKDGLSNRCKSCDSDYCSKRKQKAKIRITEKRCPKCKCVKLVSEYRIDNCSSDGHRSACKTCQSKYDSQWSKDNAGKANAKNNKRRASRRNATPPWLSDLQIKDIKFFYEFAAAINGYNGTSYDVDHIHPLAGKNFCGLHVPWNLQVLSSSDNAKKINNVPESEFYMFFDYDKSLGDCHGY